MATKEGAVVTASKESIDFVKHAIEAEKDTEFLPTGNVGFDLAISNGQGLPVGSSFLFWAAPGCGKTTILVDVCKRLIEQHKAQKKPFRVLYLAVEPSLELVKSMGLKPHIDSGDFIYITKGLCWRNVEMFYDNILGGVLKDVKLVVIDSLNNILSDANVNKSVADGDFGTKARERTMFLTKYLSLCREHGVTNFFIAQVRTNIDAGLFGPKKKSASSDGDKHNVEAIIKCTAIKSSPDSRKVREKTPFAEKDKVIAFPVRMESDDSNEGKNRFFKGTPAEIFVSLGQGCENGYAIRKLLEFNDFIGSAGGWFQFEPEFASAFKFPVTKMRKDEIQLHINEKAGEIVTFLKKVNKYNLNPKTTEVTKATETTKSTKKSKEAEAKVEKDEQAKA